MATDGVTETSHVGLQVRDIERSLGFYRDKLGLELVSRRVVDAPHAGEILGYPGASFETALLRLPRTGAFLQLTQYLNVDGTPVDPLHGNPGTCHVAFYTDDMTETWATLEKAGSELQGDDIVTIVGGVFDGGRCIYCTDPDGIRVEFLEGPAYLDATVRDLDAVPKGARANETSHAGVHVSNLDASLAFYVDQLGLEVVSKFVAQDPGTRAVIGLPEADLDMAILRLPGTNAFFEVIEYQNAPGRHRVDPQTANPGTCHLAFHVEDLDRTWCKLQDAGSRMVSTTVVEIPDGPLEGARVVCCADPDGICIELIQADAYLDGRSRAGAAQATA